MTVQNTIETEVMVTSTTTFTVTSVTEVPTSTLIIVNDTYNPASLTFHFMVQNTQNFTVYAQISAQEGLSYCGAGGNYLAFFLSPVYSLASRSITTVPFNTTLVTPYSPTSCGSVAIGQFSVNFVAGNNMIVSPTYYFYKS